MLPNFSFFVSYSSTNFWTSSSTGSEYSFSFFISSMELIDCKISNALSKSFSKYTKKFITTLVMFCLSSSRVMLICFRCSLMKSWFSWYRSPASVTVPISDSQGFRFVSSPAVRLDGMYPWSTVTSSRTSSGIGVFRGWWSAYRICLSFISSSCSAMKSGARSQTITLLNFSRLKSFREDLLIL